MPYINRATIMGHLGKDPEEISGGCRFSVATSEKWSDGTKHTEWHNVACFGKPAELALKWLKKGDLVYVEGTIKTREVDGKYYTGISCGGYDSKILFFNGKKQEDIPF